MATEKDITEIQEGPVGYEGEVKTWEGRGGAIKMFENTDDEVVLSGPAGTGKSRTSIEKLHYLLSKYPRAKGLILRKTLVSLTESGLVTYKDEVLHRLDGVVFFGGSKSEPAAFNYPNGSTLIVGGLENISKVMSKSYDVIYVQEANEITEDEHERLTTRLRSHVIPFQQIMEDVNPQEPWHWMLRRVQRGQMTMIESRHEDNPALYTREGVMTKNGESYMRRLDALTGVRLQRLRYGRWVAAEGVVYESFDSSVHLIDPFPIPKAWPRMRTIDFGFMNPFVCSWFALDPDRRLYLYRELYLTQRLVSDMAERIKELSDGESIGVTVADHASEDRATLHSAGIQTTAANKSILTGIDKVQRRLRVQGDGKPRLYIVRGANVELDKSLNDRGLPTCTSDEMVSYAWPTDATSASSRTKKDLPVDANNHGCDALRYAVMYLDRRAKMVSPSGQTQARSKWLGRFDRG